MEKGPDLLNNNHLQEVERAPAKEVITTKIVRHPAKVAITGTKAPVATATIRSKMVGAKIVSAGIVANTTLTSLTATKTIAVMGVVNLAEVETTEIVSSQVVGVDPRTEATQEVVSQSRTTAMEIIQIIVVDKIPIPKIQTIIKTVILITKVAARASTEAATRVITIALAAFPTMVATLRATMALITIVEVVLVLILLSKDNTSVRVTTIKVKSNISGKI